MSATCSSVIDSAGARFTASLSALRSASTAALSLSLNFSPTSWIAFSVWKIRESASFLSSIASFFFLSCASNSEASLTALSMSS